MGIALHELIVVDPGEEHVGIAHFERAGKWWRVSNAFTTKPDAAIDTLWALIEQGEVKEIVAEEWRIYPGHATWSTCPTAEVIGALRHKTRQCRVAFSTLPARAKKPAQGYVRRNGIPLLGDTVHAKDAELIGWAWVNGARN